MAEQAQVGPVVLFEKRDRKAYITLNRPQAMNAINSELRQALDEALRQADADDDVLVILLMGAGGRAFCAGVDLKERSQKDSTTGTVRLKRDDPLETLKKPVIAVIDGHCVAGGMEMTLRCDIRVATAKSLFGMPEPRRGLMSSTALHHLSRQIPLGEAMLLHLTGRSISAQRAYDIGLIQAVAPDREALMREAEAIAEDILLCAPLNVQAIKYIVKTGRNLPIEYSWKLGEPIDAAINKTEDRIEGPLAFAEKRKPNWKMR
jgi:enoyl-CoA hydratase/carnithine racemase